MGQVIEKSADLGTGETLRRYKKSYHSPFSSPCESHVLRIEQRIARKKFIEKNYKDNNRRTEISSNGKIPLTFGDVFPRAVSSEQVFSFLMKLTPPAKRSFSDFSSTSYSKDLFEFMASNPKKNTIDHFFRNQGVINTFNSLGCDTERFLNVIENGYQYIKNPSSKSSTISKKKKMYQGIIDSYKAQELSHENSIVPIDKDLVQWMMHQMKEDGRKYLDEIRALKSHEFIRKYGRFLGYSRAVPGNHIPHAG